MLVQRVSPTAAAGKQLREKTVLRCAVGKKGRKRNDQNEEEEMKMAEGRKTMVNCDAMDEEGMEKSPERKGRALGTRE